MSICQIRSLTSPWSPVYETLLYQIRLIYLLDSTRVLPYSRSYSTETNRTAFKLINNGIEYLVVYRIKAALVYIQCIQRIRGYLEIYESRTLDLREIPYPAQKRVGYTWCSSAPQSYLHCRLLLYLYIEYCCAALDNITQYRSIIVLQMRCYTEPGSQWRSYKTTAGSSSYQSKTVESYLNGPRPGSLIYHYVYCKVLHRRIQVLLHYMRKTMYFIYEQNIPLIETCEKSGQIPGLVKNWS